MKISKIISILVLALSYVLNTEAQVRWTIQDYSTVSALQNETLVPRSTDKVFVKSQGCLFNWNGSSTEEEDTLIGGIIKQNSITVGRWQKMCPKSIAIKLQNDQSTTLQTRTDIDGFVFNAIANKRYKIEILGEFQSAVATTGLIVAFLTNGTGKIIGTVSIPINRSMIASGLTGTIYDISASGGIVGANLVSTGVSPVNAPHCWQATLIYESTTTGTFKVQFASEIGGTAVTMLNKTTLFVTQI
ncbi:hypothetical protein [Runella limosa]|uniref:hypothetical protein n=1 Tax=Runella limosa TaxID=370978 RepID=UPI0004084E45|nr:hypothetical protein [Runella limosa]